VTLAGHKKHADTARPVGGTFHSAELALVGAPCATIQKLAQQLNESISEIKIAYVDAEHNKSQKEGHTFQIKYTDKIGSHELQFDSDHIEYEYRNYLSNADFALINGNHFKAEEQVVIISSKKQDSLQRKLDRLTHVRFFILEEDMDKPFDFLFDHNKEWQSIPVYSINEINAISKELISWYQSKIPKLNGLVLAGGKSTRMGHDKSQINYHGKPHVHYLADMLIERCNQTFISIAVPSAEEKEYEVVVDSFSNLGPYGGILSAFRSNPNTAWLTVATDVPLLNHDTLKKLIDQRDPSKMATCFHNPETNFPEPLITIWEPRAYPRLLQLLALGHTCPRKALINSEIKEIHLDNTEVLINANTPDEMNAIKAKISERQD
jgi:molybdopterin-guanine dinucleotide biosynthesis protein A